MLNDRQNYQFFLFKNIFPSLVQKNREARPTALYLIHFIRKHVTARRDGSVTTHLVLRLAIHLPTETDVMMTMTPMNHLLERMRYTNTSTFISFTSVKIQHEQNIHTHNVEKVHSLNIK